MNAAVRMSQDHEDDIPPASEMLPMGTLSVEQIAWAEDRAREFAREVGDALVLSTTPLERNTRDDVRLLESAGFQHPPESDNIYMACSLKRSLEKTDLPAGFSIAPLLENEIEA